VFKEKQSGTLARAVRTSRFWWIVIAYFRGLVAWYAVQVHQTKYLIETASRRSWQLGLLGHSSRFRSPATTRTLLISRRASSDRLVSTPSSSADACGPDGPSCVARSSCDAFQPFVDRHTRARHTLHYGVTPSLCRRPVPGLSQTARIVVEPVGRAPGQTTKNFGTGIKNKTSSLQSRMTREGLALLSKTRLSARCWNLFRRLVVLYGLAG
jgi:hypothetical protein